MRQFHTAPWRHFGAGAVNILLLCASLSSLVQICVTAEGTLSSVKILRPSHAMLDSQLGDVIGRWRFKPYELDGKATPFCYPLKYTAIAPSGPAPASR